MSETEISARIRKIAGDVAEYVATRAGSYVTAAMVQRHVRIGFARAARELDRLAEAGAIGPPSPRGRHAVPGAPKEGEPS